MTFLSLYFFISPVAQHDFPKKYNYVYLWGREISFQKSFIYILHSRIVLRVQNLKNLIRSIKIYLKIFTKCVKKRLNNCKLQITIKASDQKYCNISELSGMNSYFAKRNFKKFRRRRQHFFLRRKEIHTYIILSCSLTISPDSFHFPLFPQPFSFFSPTPFETIPNTLKSYPGAGEGGGYGTIYTPVLFIINKTYSSKLPEHLFSAGNKQFSHFLSFSCTTNFPSFFAFLCTVKSAFMQIADVYNVKDTLFQIRCILNNVQISYFKLFSNGQRGKPITKAIYNSLFSWCPNFFIKFPTILNIFQKSQYINIIKDYL